MISTNGKVSDPLRDNKFGPDQAKNGPLEVSTKAAEEARKLLPSGNHRQQYHEGAQRSRFQSASQSMGLPREAQRPKVLGTEDFKETKQFQSVKPQGSEVTAQATTQVTNIAEYRNPNLSRKLSDLARQIAKEAEREKIRAA